MQTKRRESGQAGEQRVSYRASLAAFVLLNDTFAQLPVGCKRKNQSLAFSKAGFFSLLGIDQDARQITISLRDEHGDVVQARQVSTQPEKINDFFQQLTRKRLRDGEMLREWFNVSNAGGDLASPESP